MPYQPDGRNELSNPPGIGEQPNQEIINTIVQYLHKVKNELNKIIKSINEVPGLEVEVEVLEIKADNQPPRIVGIELAVKREIYP